MIRLLGPFVAHFVTENGAIRYLPRPVSSSVERHV
jgi:hypothetical protein